MENPPLPSSSDPSSSFLSKLSSCQSSFDKNYQSQFIEYEKIRKQIKKIVYFEQQQSQYSKNSSNNNNSKEFFELNDRVCRGHASYWLLISNELNKVNQFFNNKQLIINQQLDELALDPLPSRPSSPVNNNEKSTTDTNNPPPLRQYPPVHPLTTVTFAKVLIDLYPSVSSLILESAIYSTAGQVSLCELSPLQIGLFQRFLSLVEEIDQLRKYIVINIIIMWKGVKKYNKHTNRETNETVRELLKKQSFCNKTIELLSKRAQKITDRLLNKNYNNNKENNNNNNNDSEENNNASVLCPLCNNSINVPLSLPCSHVFCFNCLLSEPGFGSVCPFCQVESEVDPQSTCSIDTLLTKFNQQLSMANHNNNNNNNSINKSTPPISSTNSNNNNNNNNNNNIMNTLFNNIDDSNSQLDRGFSCLLRDFSANNNMQTTINNENLNNKGNNKGISINTSFNNNMNNIKQNNNNNNNGFFSPTENYLNYSNPFSPNPLLSPSPLLSPLPTYNNKPINNIYRNLCSPGGHES